MRSSMLLPNTHRYSMLPAMCRNPPCRNIEVNSETRKLFPPQSSTVSGMASNPESSRGIAPSQMKNTCCSCGEPVIGSQRKNAATFAAISPIVTQGVRRVGFASRSGITPGASSPRQAS
jgi:hypothetical protein